MLSIENIKDSYVREYENDVDSICTELTMAYRDYFYLFHIGKMIENKKGMFVEFHDFIRHIIDLIKDDLVLHIYKLSDNTNGFISIHKLKNNLSKNWIGNDAYRKSFYTIPNLDKIVKPFRDIRNEKISHCKSINSRSLIKETINNAKSVLEEFRKCYNSILLDTKISLQDLSDNGLLSLEKNCEIGCQLLNKDLFVATEK